LVQCVKGATKWSQLIVSPQAAEADALSKLETVDRPRLAVSDDFFAR
jgi:hypothetical protein